MLSSGSILEWQQSEPDRRSVFRDKDDDFWWYDESVSSWVWNYSQECIGVPGVGLANVQGPHKSVHHHPMEYIGWLSGGQLVSGNPPAFTISHEDGHTRPGFVVKDSGVREEYANGFVRDTEDGKYDYARILRIEGLHLIPIEALERWGAHMVKGAEKYGEDNWKQARGPIAIGRFLRSLCRHVVQYIRKDRTEDHAAAVCFNVWAAELTPEEE